MRFTVLGPVRAWRDDTEISLGPPKQRALLGLLLTQVGHPLALHEIVDVLWGDDAPASAVNVIHRHIGLLRRLLGGPSGEAGDPLRGSGGYRLELSEEELDLLRFRALLDRGRQRRLQGDQAGAADALISALGQWTGPVASGLAPAVRAHPVFVSVDREFRTALGEATDAALACGPTTAQRVLPALRRTAAVFPLDEALHAGLVNVLVVTGHRAEAVMVLRTVRRRLTDDLGLDPGPELRAAERGLSGTMSAARSRSAAVPTAGTEPPAAEEREDQPSVPGQAPAPQQLVSLARRLPPGPAVFIGRRQEFDRLRAPVPGPGERPAAMTLSVISGMAGVGKTSLALHWAHSVSGLYPDGRFHLDLRGFHPSAPPTRPQDALRALLDVLGAHTRRVPTGFREQMDLYRSLLHGRRILLVLDNARDADQIRPLLPGAPGCQVIVTSRNRLHGLVVLDGASPITLGPLGPDESHELLARRLGARRVAEELEAVGTIVALCAGLPLALAAVIARTASGTGDSLRAVAGELRDRGLTALGAGHEAHDVRAAFSWSYRALSPGAARLFRLLSLHPGPDTGAASAAVLCDVPLKEVRPLLTELVEAHLLTEDTRGKFRSHALLRAYAGELLGARQPAGRPDTAGTPK